MKDFAFFICSKNSSNYKKIHCLMSEIIVLFVI